MRRSNTRCRKLTMLKLFNVGEKLTELSRKWPKALGLGQEVILHVTNWAFARADSLKVIYFGPVYALLCACSEHMDLNDIDIRRLSMSQLEQQLKLTRLKTGDMVSRETIAGEQKISLNWGVVFLQPSRKLAPRISST